MTCTEITKSIKDIQSLHAVFVIAVDDKDFNKVKELQRQINEIFTEILLFEKLPKENIEKQYLTQIETLRTAGILETLPSGKEGIIGIDGKEYEIPSLETVIKQIIEKRGILSRKISQGFDKFLLVPFAKELASLINSARARIIAHKQSNKLFDSDGTALELDTSVPLSVWYGYQDADRNGKLVYCPKEYSANPEKHQGKTKIQILSQHSTTSGWQVQLIEDMPDIPRKNRKKTKTLAGRKQLEAGKSPAEYLRIQQIDSTYAHETFFTPESWLTYFLSHLEETNQVIDNWSGSGSIRYLGAAYFPDFDSVSSGCWFLGSLRANLGGGNPSTSDVFCGVGSAVRIT